MCCTMFLRAVLHLPSSRQEKAGALADASQSLLQLPHADANVVKKLTRAKIKCASHLKSVLYLAWPVADILFSRRQELAPSHVHGQRCSSCSSEFGVLSRTLQNKCSRLCFRPESVRTPCTGGFDEGAAQRLRRIYQRRPVCDAAGLLRDGGAHLCVRWSLRPVSSSSLPLTGVSLTRA